MESTIHPMPLICDPKTMFVPNITVWESFLFFRLSEVLFRDESSPYSSSISILEYNCSLNEAKRFVALSPKSRMYNDVLAMFLLNVKKVDSCTFFSGNPM